MTIAAALAVYLLMVAGGVVRITGSGLGCPDWPLCYGQPLPPPEITAIIEFTHRSLAAVSGLLMIGVAGIALLRYRRARWISFPALAMIALLAVQIPLGAVVVATELDSLAVAFHLGMAMLIFACALTTAAAANRSHQAPVTLPAWYRTLVGSALAALFMLLITGALVVGAGVSYICTGWPLCEGGTGMPMLGQASPSEAISMYHRYVVAAVSVLIGAVTLRTLRMRAATRPMRRSALALGGLFMAQVAIGAGQVLLGMPALWRALHLAAGTGVWAALVMLAAQAALSAAQSREEAAAMHRYGATPQRFAQK